MLNWRNDARFPRKAIHAMRQLLTLVQADWHRDSFGLLPVLIAVGAAFWLDARRPAGQVIRFGLGWAAIAPALAMLPLAAILVFGDFHELDGDLRMAGVDADPLGLLIYLSYLGGGGVGVNISFAGGLATGAGVLAASRCSTVLRGAFRIPAAGAVIGGSVSAIALLCARPLWQNFYYGDLLAVSGASAGLICGAIFSAVLLRQ